MPSLSIPSIVSATSATSLTKHCYDCDRHLPFSEFHRNRAARDGFSAYCKGCMFLRRHGINLPRPHRGSLRVQARVTGDYKYCPRCHTTKRLSQDFYVNHTMADHRTSFCKSCHVKYTKSHEDKARVRAYARAYSRLYRARKKQEAAALQALHAPQ